MRTRLAVLVALLVAALAGASLAACASGGAGDDAAQPGETVSSSPSSEPVQPRSASPLPPSGRVSPPSDPAATASVELTLTGQPEEGVEAGCVVMRSGGMLYNLLGGDRSMLLSGKTVVVRGKTAPGLRTICQQGIPFQVSEVRAA